MKVIIVGMGSVGMRHARNLRALLPGSILVGADPISPLAPVGLLNECYLDGLHAIAAHPDAGAAIIASPTRFHLEHIEALSRCGIPFYCEKPLLSIGQTMPAGLVSRSECAVGYQYRFHPTYREAAPIIRDNGSVRFFAQEDLLSRYGPDCLSILAAHPIDTALWLLGPALDVDMETNGLQVYGEIYHERGVSRHHYQIDHGPRVSTVSSGETRWALEPTNDMYLDALRVWLAWVNGAGRDDRTATLADGLVAVRVMEQVEQIEQIKQKEKAC